MSQKPVSSDPMGSKASRSLPAVRAAKPATILDVAAAAGVSRQTVTRAMNGMPGIKSSTRERVLELARELNYTPSRFARGLVQGSHVSVGLAIPDLGNPYYPAFASSVVEQATARGWHVVVDDFGHGGRSALDAVERLAPQVDAVIGYLGADADRALVLMSGRPLVALDFADEGFAGASIAFDYARAASAAVGYLRRQGRQRIVYIDWPGAGASTGTLDPLGRGLSVRGSAFAALLSDASPGTSTQSASPHSVVRAAGESAAAAKEAVEALLERSPDTDAVIAFNDLMAAGALKALAQAGRNVPVDCAVLGMDGIPLGELLTPELSTLGLDLREVGRTAVELLDGLLSGAIQPGTPEVRRVIRHELLLRGSA
ncbi:LacI family DNA-binding transcriptional regulator [Arthrobacter sp. efr-133-TYG-118]|uniref:LacI family DNA-binding transcriptional regulator n=1 Tax=Arthrobacter sp. efr-133-TYG-118 TaxID=3040279 RepID=UPI00254D5E2F|nr:LacI family DNA-binding transcriptional regulator [Arthrobacter sp. efr-133-TYG-118]